MKTLFDFVDHVPVNWGSNCALMVEASAATATKYVASERGMVVVECDGEGECKLSRRGHRHLKLLWSLDFVVACNGLSADFISRTPRLVR